jgi:hypothetical protein
VWLAGTSHTRRARRFAQANAIGAIATSIVGNAAYHAVSVRLLTVSWPIVVVVGAVPAAVLGLTAHLHALRTIERDSPGPDAAEDGTDNRAESGTESEPQSGQESGPKDGTQDRTESGTEHRSPTRTRSRSRRRTKSRTEDELIAAARTADTEYRTTHNGRPITRDELRAALRIAGPKATELRRRLIAEQAEAQPEASTEEPAEAPDRKEAYTTA